VIYKIHEGDLIRQGLGIINGGHGFLLRAGPFVYRMQWDFPQRKLDSKAWVIRARP
jgi:hypothetical protein